MCRQLKTIQPHEKWCVGRRQMMTAEGTRQGTFCPEKGAPRPVNERLPTGKGREPVQHGLEGKAVGGGGRGERGADMGRLGCYSTPKPDKRRQAGKEGAGGGRPGKCFGNKQKRKCELHKRNSVSSTVPTITVSRRLGRTGRPYLEFHPLDFILRFKDLSSPPQLPSDHFWCYEHFLMGNDSKTRQALFFVFSLSFVAAKGRGTASLQERIA